MILALAIILFLALTTVITSFGYTRYVKPVHMLDQLATSVADSALLPVSGFEAAEATGTAKFLGSVANFLPASPGEQRLLKRKLSAAGFRSPHAAKVLTGSKIVACSLLLVLSLLARNSITSSPVSRLALPISAAVIGYLLPGLVLGHLTKRRQEQIRLALPDVLDLLVICTEAGCALDKAILNVSREFRTFHPAISEELSLVNMEMLAGGSRVEALRNFASRTGEEELKKLVAILVQTDRFGTSVAEALRTQSDFLRVQRRQLAEERAGKVGVKLVFPIFFFCMPSLMVLVAGPGMITLFQNLKMLSGGQ